MNVLALCVAVASLAGSSASAIYARANCQAAKEDLAELRAKLATEGVTQSRPVAAPIQRMPTSLYDRRPEET